MFIGGRQGGLAPRWVRALVVLSLATTALAVGGASPAEAGPAPMTWVRIGGDGSRSDPQQVDIGDGGSALVAPISGARSVDVGPDGSVYVVSNWDAVRRIAPDGKISTIAGRGTSGLIDRENALGSSFSSAQVAVAPNGDVYIASGSDLFRLDDNRLVDVARAVPAAEYWYGAITAIDVDPAGRLLVADADTVRRVNPNGTATLLMGRGATAWGPDGSLGLDTKLAVRDVAGSVDGSIYVITYNPPDWTQPRVYRLGTDGRMTWVMGNPYGSQPACARAPQATLPGPARVTTDGRGRVFVTDGGSIFMRRLDGMQQGLGGASSETIIDIAVNGNDQLVTIASTNVQTWEVTGPIDHGSVNRSSQVIDREWSTCGQTPYATPAALVDALAARYSVKLGATDRLLAIDDIRTTKVGAAALVDDWSHRPAWATTVGPVARLYRASFNRPAETNGLTYWVTKRRAGTTLDGVALGFVNSPEFKQTYGPLTNAAFVDRVYRNVLGRAPDANGLAYWTGKLKAGQSRGKVMIGFSESTEYRTKLRSYTEATLATYAMLGRAPTPVEVQAWTTGFSRGLRVEDLIAQVWYSAEHRTKIRGAGA